MKAQLKERDLILLHTKMPDTKIDLILNLPELYETPQKCHTKIIRHLNIEFLCNQVPTSGIEITFFMYIIFRDRRMHMMFTFSDAVGLVDARMDSIPF
jgi:hypothetical protein